MPVYAELHDGRRLEFPDGTDPKVIQSTVKKLVAKPAEESYAPDDPGAAGSALIAAGRGTDRLIKGAQQIWYAATGNQQGLDGLADTVAEDDRLYKPLAEKHPIATDAGNIVPAMAMTVGTGGGGLVPMMVKSALSSAVPGALEYGSLNERASRAGVNAVGGAIGAAGGQLLSRVLKPAGVGAPSVSKEVLDAADRIGYKPTPAQITQSPFLGNLENFFSKNPGSTGAMQAINEANQTALNRASAKAMGEATSDLGESTFAAAKARLGSEFDRLGQVTAPKLGDDFLSALGHIDAANKARGPFMNKNVDGLIDKGLDLAAQGNLTGKAYKEIRTELANQAQSAFRGGDATTGQAYKSVVAALDDAANKSLPKADQEAWGLARQQWSAYKTLTKGNVAEAGNVSAPRVAAALRRNGDALRTGAAKGELADVARIGEAFKGVQNPNSGNLVNQLAYQNVAGPAMMAANRLASSAYLSNLGRKYFTNGLIDVGAGGQLVLTKGAGLLGAPSARGLLGVE